MPIAALNDAADVMYCTAEQIHNNERLYECDSDLDELHSLKSVNDNQSSTDGVQDQPGSYHLNATINYR